MVDVEVMKDMLTDKYKEEIINSVKNSKNWIQIGKGAFSIVYRDRDLAIKKIMIDYPSSEETILKYIRKKKKSEPYCLQYIGTFKIDYTTYLVTHYIEGTTLNKLRSHTFSALEMIKIIRHLITGLAFLHKNKILHRDIKPENIILDNVTAKFIDFGYACFSYESDKLLNFEGSYVFRPLEVLNLMLDYQLMTDDIDEKYSHSEIINIILAGDIWSLGVSLYETFNKKLLFTANSIEKLLHMVKTTSVKSETKNEKIDSIINAMLESDYKKRKSAKEIMLLLED